MHTGKMHADEVDTDISLVGRLVAAQFPRWAGLPIQPVRSAGTDNALYRLGDEMVVRLPRIHWAVGQVEKEQEWLPRLAPLLPLAIPVPLAQGTPADEYPWEWSVYRWLEGETATIERIADPGQAATDLARFVAALQRVDPTNGPPPGDHNGFRGVPLATRDAATRTAIASLARRDRRRRRDRCVGRIPGCTGVGRPARLDPRRPPIREPAGRAGTVERRHRLRVSRRGRPRVRLDGRLDTPFRRDSGRLPRRALCRRRDVGAGSRLGTLLGADRPALLPGHEPCNRPGCTTNDRLCARRSRADVSLTPFPRRFTGVAR